LKRGMQRKKKLLKKPQKMIEGGNKADGGELVGNREVRRFADGETNGNLKFSGEGKENGKKCEAGGKMGGRLWHKKKLWGVEKEFCGGGGKRGEGKGGGRGWNARYLGFLAGNQGKLGEKGLRTEKGVMQRRKNQEKCLVCLCRE